MALCSILLALFFSIPTASAQTSEPSSTLHRATVVSIEDERPDGVGELTRTVQTVLLRLEDGPRAGQTFSLENGTLPGRDDTRLSTGETVVVEEIVKADGSTEYLLREKYRLTAVIILVVAFFALTILLGRMTGFTSMLGLLVSIGILVFFVVPRIADGENPLVISMIGSFAIACTSLYLAHGFNRRTTVALLSTLLTLGISVLLALLFVHVGKLFGTGSEESMFLQLGPLEQVNLRGLLLGGIVIGCLGVLDDITTAQTAAVDEIRKANPTLRPDQLLRAGMSVGREHIASLINTLALAYAGASLPLLLLFRIQNDTPLWVTLNSEFLAEEIIRTLVGSASLLFAVPISTWLAATLLPQWSGNRRSTAHPFHHHHH